MSEEAACWSVLFHTSDGMTHPVRFSWKVPKHRTAAEAAARSYLKARRDWLTGIEDIYPTDPPSKTSAVVWVEHPEQGGVRIWTWAAREGVKYMVTQRTDEIVAYVTTGEKFKFTRSIGKELFATPDEAREACIRFDAAHERN